MILMNTRDLAVVLYAKIKHAADRVGHADYSFDKVTVRIVLNIALEFNFKAFFLRNCPHNSHLNSIG